MSSEAAPDDVGAVTGFMLGFSVGVGGFGALGFGGAADRLSLACRCSFEQSPCLCYDGVCW